jgi:hypothetical protein
LVALIETRYAVHVLVLINRSDRTADQQIQSTTSTIATIATSMVEVPSHLRFIAKSVRPRQNCT